MKSFRGIKYQIVNKTKGKKRVVVDDNVFIFKYPCSNTSDCSPYKLLLSPGYYQFELWGAYGGDARYQNTPNLREDSGGKGAYVSGKLAVVGTLELYLYIGGQGEDQVDIYTERSKGGYNGGGNGGVDWYDPSEGESSAGGGGASDLRLILDQSLEGWKSRILVAAGGGGACSTNHTNSVHSSYKGGDGGALESHSDVKMAVGGTQTTGIFGYGQDGLDFDDDTFQSGGSTGGSGGGYYGGQTFEYKETTEYQEMAGAGGSSFISGYSQCNAVKYENSNNKVAHSSQPIHYSNLFFNEGIMKDNENDDFIDQSTISEFDNTKNGVARITIIQSYDSLPLFYTFKVKAELKLSAIFSCILFKS